MVTKMKSAIKAIWKATHVSMKRRQKNEKSPTQYTHKWYKVIAYAFVTLNRHFFIPDFVFYLYLTCYEPGVMRKK